MRRSSWRRVIVVAAVVAAIFATASAGARPGSGRIFFYSNINQPVNSASIKNPLSVRPSTIPVFEDGSWVLASLHWRGWGSPVAHATGVSSAAGPGGKRKNTRAQFTLSSPGRVLGQEVYRCFQLTVPPPASSLHECLKRTGKLILYSAVSATTSPTRAAIYTPSRNITCLIADNGQSAGVYCAMLKPPTSVTMDSRGRLKQICHGTRCVGNPGENTKFKVLPYGRSIKVGRFRCRSQTTGLTCIVAATGKGFLIAKAGVKRVGGKTTTVTSGPTTVPAGKPSTGSGAANGPGLSPNSLISRIAGPAKQGSNTFPGFSGDGGPAQDANVGAPRGLAVDAKGNLYIADTQNDRVRMVDSNGIIRTVAGGGPRVPGLGDGGPATKAFLATPSGVAVDSRGNLYIADFDDGCVRKVTPDGIISTFAGAPAPAPQLGCREGYGGDGGPATAALLSGPRAVAVDAAGNVYIAEGGRVRKVTPDGIISTVATNIGYLEETAGLAVDGKGDLYIVDQARQRVLKLSPNGKLSLFAGNGKTNYCNKADGGLATKANFFDVPRGVTADRFGNVYIADSGIRRVDPQGRISTIVTPYTYPPCTTRPANMPLLKTIHAANSGRVKNEHMGAVALVADPSGNLYVIDGGNRVIKISNAPPLASFTATPSSGHQPLVVSLNASGSQDPDGKIVHYAWSFGDGASGAGTSLRHTYRQAGTFRVTLTVTDDTGLTGSATRAIRVG